MEISLLDLKYAYLAGILDGEGSIYVKYERSRKVFRMVLKVGNTCEELIQFVSKEWRCNYGVHQPKDRKTDNCMRARMYTCVVYGDQACLLLQKMYPFLIVKKKQAEICYKFWNARHVLAAGEKEDMVRELHKLGNKDHDPNWNIV